MRFFLIFFPLFLVAQEDIILYTLTADAKDSVITFSKDSSVDYKNYHIESLNSRYLQKSEKLNFYGDIELLKNKEFTLYAKRGVVDLKKSLFSFSSFFFTESLSDVWISGKKIDLNKDKVIARNSYVSSCSSECSDWKIYFEKGVLDRKKDWLSLYNIKLYAKDTPIFYFPYFGFSTIKKRHTGFLKPRFRLSNQEGFVYIQPFFYAPKNWWDLEVIPQIRTKRGIGAYATLRFVDSNSSYGELISGYFREKDSYYRQKDLKNKSHYGIELFYKRFGLFSQGESKDGVYIDVKSYNDIDYFNLQKSTKEGATPLCISRFNYIFEKERDYFGFYAKYFKDNTKVSNSDTLQILPTLHYHRYYRNFFNRHFAYDIDGLVTHYYRDKGLNAIEYSIDTPLSFQSSFFNDLIGFSISENINAKYANYSLFDTDENLKNYYIVRNSHQINFFTDLIKSYNVFDHYLNFDVLVNIPSFEKEGGDRAEFINIADNSKKATITLKQYFYKDNKELFYHRLTQMFNYDLEDKSRDLENEFGVKYGNLDFNFDIFYSHKYSNISAIKTQLNYHDEKTLFYLSHFYKNRRVNEEDSNFIIVDFVNVLSKKYKLFATIEYDFITNNTRSWSFGWRMNKRCWSYEISYKKDIRPLLTTEGNQINENRTIYFRIELYPFGGFSKSFRSTQEQRIF